MVWTVGSSSVIVLIKLTETYDDLVEPQLVAPGTADLEYSAINPSRILLYVMYIVLNMPFCTWVVLMVFLIEITSQDRGATFTNLSWNPNNFLIRIESHLFWKAGNWEYCDWEVIPVIPKIKKQVATSSNK